MKKITLSLIALLILSTFLINCGGGSGGSSSPGGEKPGVPEIVQVLPSHYVAMTNSAILIRAKILNGNGGPVKNLPVTFTNISPIGTLMNSNDAPLGNKTVVRTNDSGMATIKVKATTTGFVTIQAEVNKGVGVVRDRRTMYFGSPLSLTTFMYLDADGDNDQIYNEPDDYTLFQNNNANDNQVLFRATVFSKFGQRASGSKVTFGADFPYKPYKVDSSTECSDGSSSCSVTFPNGNTAITNLNGEAFVLVRVDPVMRNITPILNITAVADNGASKVYSLFLEPITIDSITVNANPSIVALNEKSTISASVKLLHTGGPPPDGTAVGFVATCGTVTPFALTTTGLATATFTAPSTAPSPPVCRVTATVEGISNYADITISSALTVQPSTQTISGLFGGTVSYIISGGVAPYTVTSSDRFKACNSTDADCSDAEDSGIWTVSASGGIFTVTVPPGTAAQDITLSVRDLVGATASATLVIGGAGALSVQPSAVSISGDIGGQVTFTIFGGYPPYDIFPNNADPAFAPVPSQVAASGGTFIVTVPPSTPATEITYTVRDSAAKETSGKLTITATAPTGLLVIPASQSVIAPDTASFNVSGGTPPYVITSTDPSSACNSSDPDCIDAADSGIWNLAAAGSFTVTVPSTAVAGNITLNVFDSLGATKSATLTIISGGAATGITINPASISVTGLAGATDNVIFTITGGTPVYSVFSSNTAVAIASMGPTATTFTVDPKVVAATTAATLTVVDSLGLNKTATITVTPLSSSLGVNPSTLAVTLGTMGIGFNIIGGLSPYTVYSSDSSIVSLVGVTTGGPNTVAGTSFTADAVGVGSATIAIVDDDGKTVTSSITVAGSPITVTPPSIDVSCGAAPTTVTFFITGGVAPYDVTSTSSIVTIAGSPVAASGGSFTATVNSACTAGTVTIPVSIVISDSVTAVATATVNVIDP